MNTAKRFRREQWKMLSVTMLCYFFFYTGRHNFGWAAKSIAAEFHLSYTEIGWISSCMLLGYGIGQLLNGNFADRFNPRYMVTAGACLSVAANFALSFSTSYVLILFFWTINGYFQSMAWAPGSRLISNWWRKEERGKAFGLYTMAAGWSSVLTFLLSILLIRQDMSWRYLFRIPVLFLLAAAVVFFFIARSKPSDKGFENLYPEKPDSPVTNWKDDYKTVLKNKKFLVASIALGFESMARYGLIVWVPVHFLGPNGGGSSDQLWPSLLMPTGMALGAYAFGILSDTFFKRNRPASIRAGMLLSACTILLMYFLPVGNFWVMMLLMFIAGFFVYGPQSNFWPMSPELLGEKYVGTGIGIMNACAYLFAALGEPVYGKVIDLTGDTRYVFLAITFICLLGATTISISARMKNREHA